VKRLIRDRRTDTLGQVLTTDITEYINDILRGQTEMKEIQTDGQANIKRLTNK
jgi:hypothetical protein